MSIVLEKVNQAIGILNEKDIDVWLTFVRETSSGGDPVLPLIYGHSLTWQSALIITRSGERIAILGHYEADTARHTGAYDQVYATGHHLGRLAHDGAGILGPEWVRYGNTPNYVVEAGHVYTLEPGLFVDGYGYIGIEEDVLVTENGVEFLRQPQERLILL